MKRSFNTLRHVGLAFLATFLVTACGSSTDTETMIGGPNFQLVFINVPQGGQWAINRPIELTFNKPVDFASVTNSSINVATLQGKPALGEFFLKTSQVTGETLPNVVVWQPRCPTLGDFSDAGLSPGGVTYRLLVQGLDGGTGIAVRSANGERLALSQQRTFTTPQSIFTSELFFDPVAGPPALIVRDVLVSTGPGSFLELADDPNQKEFFQVTQGQAVPVPDVPINLLSDPEQSVAIVLEFDQPVDPSSENISPERVRLEYQAAPGVWVPVPAAVTLVANCTQVGARVRVEPLGILPPSPLPPEPASLFRVNVAPEFSDLVGEFSLVPQNNQIRFSTQDPSHPGLSQGGLLPEGLIADEIFEDFLLGAPSFGSLEDPGQILVGGLPTLKASWGGGSLNPNFGFLGTGGPGGNFDWIVLTDRTLNTDSDTITSTLGIPQPIVNGLVNVRNLTVAEGATLTIQGAAPLRLFATGEINFQGRLVARGGNASSTGGLNVPNIPAPGAPGIAGGGRGGTGSPVTTGSTPIGGSGFGAFNTPGGGGVGGETAWANVVPTIATSRRGPGGGGGRFAFDLGTANNAPFVIATDLRATAGGAGSPGTLGGVSQNLPPVPGPPGPPAFIDNNNFNNFFGVGIVGGTLQVGELLSPWAGSGGGGGGDSVNAAQFPANPWLFNNGQEQKGGGAGGGGGSVRIVALGDIIVGPQGGVSVRGGNGALGEHTSSNNSIGGGSGAGSGGHLILESGQQIHLLGPKVLDARGGNPAAQGSGGIPNQGGRGGVGVVQLHVESAEDILLPGGANGSNQTTLNNSSDPQPYVLALTFGSRSRARSVAIPLGGAAQNPGSQADPRFFFGGTFTTAEDPDKAGEVKTIGAAVENLPAILSGGVLELNAPARTIVVDASALVSEDPNVPILDDIYLRNTRLLREFRVRLEEGPASQNLNVESAAYDADSRLLTLVLRADTGITVINPNFTGIGLTYELVPRFFRVRTGNTFDTMPTGSSIAVRFQGLGTTTQGTPDVLDPVVDWTPNISGINDASSEIDFVRFEVEFNLGTLDANAPRPQLRFLRVPLLF